MGNNINKCRRTYISTFQPIQTLEQTDPTIIQSEFSADTNRRVLGFYSTPEKDNDASHDFSQILEEIKRRNLPENNEEIKENKEIWDLPLQESNHFLEEEEEQQHKFEHVHNSMILNRTRKTQTDYADQCRNEENLTWKIKAPKEVKSHLLPNGESLKTTDHTFSPQCYLDSLNDFYLAFIRKNMTYPEFSQKLITFFGRYNLLKFNEFLEYMVTSKDFKSVFYLSLLVLHGEESLHLNPDDSQAIELLELCAKADIPEAKYELGRHFVGKERKYEKGEELLISARDYGFVEAFFALGDYYLLQQRDVKKAEECYNKGKALRMEEKRAQ